MNAKPPRGNVVKKAVRSMNIVQRKIKSTAKPSLLTRYDLRNIINGACGTIRIKGLLLRNPVM
jgi:hypothetical protein